MPFQTAFPPAAFARLLRLLEAGRGDNSRNRECRPGGALRRLRRLRLLCPPLFLKASGAPFPGRLTATRPALLPYSQTPKSGFCDEEGPGFWSTPPLLNGAGAPKWPGDLGVLGAPPLQKGFAVQDGKKGFWRSVPLASESPRSRVAGWSSWTLMTRGGWATASGSTVSSHRAGYPYPGPGGSGRAGGLGRYAAFGVKRTLAKTGELRPRQRGVREVSSGLPGACPLVTLGKAREARIKSALTSPRPRRARRVASGHPKAGPVFLWQKTENTRTTRSLAPEGASRSPRDGPPGYAPPPGSA